MVGYPGLPAIYATLIDEYRNKTLHGRTAVHRGLLVRGSADMATRLKEVDAVMVGMGWTGSIMARELTKAGLTVVGLERGEDLHAARAFRACRTSATS